MRQVRFGILVPLLLVPALIIHVAGPEAAGLLRYERAAIMEGQLWRLISGHFVHLGATHLLLNGFALVLLIAAFGSRRLVPVAQIITLPLIIMAGTSAGLLLFNDALDWYVGLSGLLHGIAVWVAVGLWPQDRPLALLLLAALAAKLLWEQVTDTAPLFELTIGGSVIVDAHLYGAVTAAIAGLVWVAVHRLRRQQAANEAATQKTN